MDHIVINTEETTMCYSLNDPAAIRQFFGNPAGGEGFLCYLRETFEVITPESAEHGEAAEQGFIDEEGSPFEASELRVLLEGTEHSGNGWATAYGEVQIDNGATENRSYHPISPLDRILFELAWEAANE